MGIRVPRDVTPRVAFELLNEELGPVKAALNEGGRCCAADLGPSVRSSAPAVFVRRVPNVSSR